MQCGHYNNMMDYEEIFIDRTLSTISEQDGDDDDDNADDDDYEDNSDDLLNASSASSDNSIEWRTETSWPWYQNDWNIFITNPKTTIEIWARLIGMEYSDALDSLTAKIAFARKQQPATVKIDEIYVSFAFGQWHRVRVIKQLTKPNSYQCFFIDTGEEWLIPSKSLYVCENVFRNLLPQAICFSLDGLNDFAEHPYAVGYLKENLLGKTLVANILTNEEQYLAECNSYPERLTKIPAKFYDTSVPNEDIELNKLFIKQITEATPSPSVESMVAAKISHISRTGKLYLHLIDNDLPFINKLLKEIVGDKKRLQKANMSSMLKFSKNLHLVYDEFDKDWYRAYVIANADYYYNIDAGNVDNENSHDNWNVGDNVFPGNQSNQYLNDVRLCFCTDFGTTKTIKLANIYNLHSLSIALYKYPCQAIPVKLNHLPTFSAYILSRLRCVLNACTTVIVKPVILDTIPPIVDIYKRDVPNNNLIYINEWMMEEEELQNVGMNLSLDDSFSLDD